MRFNANISSMSGKLVAASSSAQSRPTSRLTKWGVMMMLAIATLMQSCRIEPPLHLADDSNIVFQMPEVVTDINVVWDIDADWESDWWYGWDDEDIRRWGKIEYPTPTNYEVRIYYRGDSPKNPWEKVDRTTVYANSFSRRFEFGYHDMLLWSNIDSDDFSQVLIVREDDPDNIFATTSRSRLSYGMPGSRAGETYNNPEIFYGTNIPNIFISHDMEDYDYYDEDRGVWVKRIQADLYPLVYVYLVQVVIYNNNGRITNILDQAAVSSMADGVSVHTGHTSMQDVSVTYDMRLKHELPARDGRPADILGGKLTTFGLCDMDSWARSRATRYSGSRGDLVNKLHLDLKFSNTQDSVYTFDITPQLQRQIHGGIITIELDADTIRPPANPRPPNPSTFDPIVVDRTNEEIDIPM